MKKTGEVTRRQIEELLGLAESGRKGAVDHVCGHGDARASSLVFAVDDRALQSALDSGAGLVLSQVACEDARVLLVSDARTAFARVYHAYFDEQSGGGVHPSATLAAGVTLGPDCSVGAGCVLEEAVSLGAGCVLGPRVTVHAGTTLGARVRVQSGAVLGSDGFGYVSLRAGYLRFPQIGTLTIEDDVEIGANTTIDRGALGETRIGRGTKIDNLVHIAHNCVIGEDVIIAAQVGLAGSTTIGNRAMLGGQAGLGERVTIGEGVILGGQGGVLPGKTLEGSGEVFWGTPARPVREYLRDVARMRKR